MEHRYWASLMLGVCGLAASCVERGEVVGGSCPECSITLTEVAQLESADEAPTSLPVAVIAGARGIYALFRDDLAAVSMYDHSGAHLRTYRRPGQGPGELSFPFGLSIGRGDTLAVYDPGSARRNLFTSDLEFVTGSTLALPNQAQAAIELRDGTTLVTRKGMAVGDRELIHHVLSRDGRHVRSFGRPFDTEDRRRVFVDSIGQVWSMHPDRAMIAQYSRHGDQLRTVEIDLDWLQLSEAESPSSGEGPVSAEPPDASVSDLQVDAAGRIWVLGYVPDEEWEGAERSEYGARYDGMITVATPDGQVLTSLRTDDFVDSWAGPGLLVLYRLSAFGEPVIRLMNVGLDGI